ncbi:ABC transporter ATP-binding protein [Kineosporia succinea]|uniref:Peptide/nickel transport system ATP-binding protein n=1 Tax=Kineosporia succinea TaxID=84632 RepID=A0ABT9P796_9ACTN|nr:ABC transporter ATP-binding protein [Kineosporia succinea]MDP9828561.1 peptide/nickel transport system ATP-binding protein [Kineosporia succinea]
MTTVLSVRDLKVEFDVPAGRLPAVNGVSFDLFAGELLALVGESGSGKSALTMGLTGLNRGPRTHISGTADFDGTDLVAAGDKQLQRIRGAGIAVVFQDALAALNPVQRVGKQVAEMIRQHQPVSSKEAALKAVSLLRDVGLANPEQSARAYPHQLSGGMRQRVMIAIALANDPGVLIADEPTTALDVTIQAQVLALLKRMQREHGSAVVLITHDLGVVAEVADRIAVMYAGRIVEIGTRDEVLNHPRHPYTVGLLNSMPRIDGPRPRRLAAIKGNPLTGVDRPPGCAFAPRCDLVQDECLEQVPPLENQVACLRAGVA